jgi:outer membrane receptor protein involved in Fe transport
MHGIDENNSLNFSYSRRITRPTFWNLAPFVIFMDPNTYFSGNPGLQPSISDNVTLGYTYKSKILSLTYSYESDPITEFSPNIDSVTNKETLAAANQHYRKTVTISLSLPVTITRWWNMQANLNGSFQEIKGWYNGAVLIIDSKNFYLSGQQNFILPKQFTLSLSGFYRSANLFGISRSRGLGLLDAGLQKKFTKINSTLRLNWGNIFNTFIFRTEINQPDKNLIATGRLLFTRPSVRLTYTHNFGNDKLMAKRNRSLGNEEEKDRLKQ